MVHFFTQIVPSYFFTVTYLIHMDYVRLSGARIFTDFPLYAPCAGDRWFSPFQPYSSKKGDKTITHEDK